MRDIQSALTNVMYDLDGVSRANIVIQRDVDGVVGFPKFLNQTPILECNCRLGCKKLIAFPPKDRVSGTTPIIRF